MRYIRIPIDGPKVHLYPLVCWHIGAKQSSLPFIEHIIKRIKKDPLARWIYMGDAGECATRLSKGNIYEQLLNPGDQLREAALLLSPIKEKGLFGLRGNHGNRIDKETGIGWDEQLCTRIGIPYLGVSALANLVFTQRSDQSKLSASVYVHHGTGGSVSPAGKMSAGHRAESFVIADVILTAHTHACGECFPTRHYAYISQHVKDVAWGSTRSFVCGSAYDSRSGYSEEKMYPPLLPEHIIIKLAAARKRANNNDRVYLTIDSEKILMDANEKVVLE